MKILGRRQQRLKRVRGSIKGSNRARLSVHRTNKHIYAQIIDDVKGKTVASASDLELKATKGTKSDIAKKVGVLIAEKAKKVKVSAVVFDRGSYKFHGRVREIATGAREGGLKF